MKQNIAPFKGKTDFPKKYLTRWSEDNFKAILEICEQMEMKPMEFIRFCVNEKIREIKGTALLIKARK